MNEKTFEELIAHNEEARLNKLTEEREVCELLEEVFGASKK